MDNTIEFSMTEMEFQFDSMEDEFADPFDMDSELIQDTEIIEMRLREGSSHQEDSCNTAIKKRVKGLPDKFGNDWDSEFDDGFNG